MEPKPLASLSANLLARKGAARPAMRRPQMGHIISPTLPVSVQDDLGWNDMGEESPAAPPPLKMVTSPDTPPAAPTSEPAPPPDVVRQQENLAQKLSGKAPKRESAAAKDSRAKKLVDAHPRIGKAAFTLRLDPDRHLRLRLACAVGNRSAQQIVTQALDALLDSQPHLEALAKQVPSISGAKRK